MVGVAGTEPPRRGRVRALDDRVVEGVTVTTIGVAPCGFVDTSELLVFADADDAGALTRARMNAGVGLATRFLNNTPKAEDSVSSLRGTPGETRVARSPSVQSV